MKNFIGAEWKDHFTNKKILIPVLAVLFIPLMYSGMFLWAFWDPYERLDDLPVAVVNMDEGAQFEEMELAIGDDLSKNLKDNPSFQWEFVNKDEAYQGLENQKYYMVIEIPEDFSKRATTLLDEKPFPMELKYVPNESYNFLSAQIGSTAVEKIKEEVSNELTATYAEEMFANIEKLGDGFSQAADGTHQLNEGVAEIQSGSGDLKEALSQAAEKSAPAALLPKSQTLAYYGVRVGLGFFLRLAPAVFELPARAYAGRRRTTARAFPPLFTQPLPGAGLTRAPSWLYLTSIHHDRRQSEGDIIP